jgi:cation:H+ antiporter
VQDFLVFLLFIAGFVLIIKGGDYLVDSAIKIAKATGIPEIIIGATIVSLATTLPEFMVSVIAASKGNIAFAVGNATGSMLCNCGLTLALALAVSEITAKGRALPFKVASLAFSAILAYFCIAFDNKLDIWEGCVLLVGFAAFMALNIIEAKHDAAVTKENGICKKEKPSKSVILLFLLGAVGIGVGAWLLVDYGTKVAGLLGVPAHLIAITMVAIGTGLPELVTGLTSLKKRKANLCIGNIIGANIINGTLLLGLVSLIGNGIRIEAELIYSLPVLIALSLILAIPLLYKKRTYKWQGYAMFALYAAFLAYNIITVR